MIREPTVGMRVKITEDITLSDRYKKGDTGTIECVETDKMHYIDLDGKESTYINECRLTEIKENDMEKGDLVTITDGNHSLFMGSDFNRNEISTTCKFKVIGLPEGIWGNEGDKWHDIILKNKTTGNIWLHSKRYCKKVVEVKEITPEQMMEACEEKYGGKVKITKK